MRNKRNSIFLTVLAIMFSVLSIGETLFLYKGLPFAEKFMTAVNETADFSFMNEKSSFSPREMRGMNVDLSKDFDFEASEQTVKNHIASSLYDATGFDCNTVIITNTGSVSTLFDAVEYVVNSAKGLDMNVGFAVNILKNGKLDFNTVKSVYTKYQPDFFLITDYPSITGNDDIISYLTSVRSYIDDMSAFCKVGYSVGFDITDEKIIPLCSTEYSDFIIVDSDRPSSSEGYENRIKTFGNLYMQYGVPVILNIHNELTLSGGDWNSADEVVNQLKCSLYNGMCGVVINSCRCVETDYKGTAVSVFSFFQTYNNVDYTALDITSFGIKDNILKISGTAKQDYPVFINNSLTGDLQQKTVDKSLKFSFDVKLDYGKNIVTLIHKNATYTYRLTVAEDLIKNVTFDSDKKNVRIECSSLENANVYCYFSGEYKKMEKTRTDTDGRVIYACDYKTLFPKTVSKSDISIGAECSGLSDTLIGGERTPSPYCDNGCGRADCVRVIKDYSETTPASESSDLSVPTYSFQLKDEIGTVDKIGVYKNTVLYKLKNGIQLSSSDAEYIVNGYNMPENNCVISSSESDNRSVYEFKFDCLPFTRILPAPQNYYVGYLQREYNVDGCEAEYVDIELKDTDNVEYGYVNENDALFSGYEIFENAGSRSKILRLYLREKGQFYGYSLKSSGKNSFIISFNHKKDYKNAQVIIDAGHGGSGDVGTYSFDGKYYEKSVTLDIALKVQSILQSYGINAELTRSADYNLGIRERQIITRLKNADCFVSLHCDGSTDTSVYGTHTFYYNSYSKALADSIHKNLVVAYRSYCYTDSKKPQFNGCDLGVKFFPYGVTRITECPAVLVECGYLTNKNDEMFVVSESGSECIANAVAQGIINSLG